MVKLGSLTELASIGLTGYLLYKFNPLLDKIIGNKQEKNTSIVVGDKNTAFVKQPTQEEIKNINDKINNSLPPTQYGPDNSQYKQFGGFKVGTTTKSNEIQIKKNIPTIMPTSAPTIKNEKLQSTAPSIISTVKNNPIANISYNLGKSSPKVEIKKTSSKSKAKIKLKPKKGYKKSSGGQIQSTKGSKTKIVITDSSGKVVDKNY